MAAKQKVVLAYSGGLDTSVLVRILTDEYGYDVIACHADVGESKDHERLKARAREAGAGAGEGRGAGGGGGGGGDRRREGGVPQPVLLPRAAGQRALPGRLSLERRAL